MSAEARSNNVSNPSVLLPYPGPDATGATQDIFVYMRPETNGVLAESAVLRVVERCPEYKSRLNLVYLANLPGDFIIHEHIVEEHYALKLYFAVHGKAAFTGAMQERFTEYFNVPFDDAPVIGSFEAVRQMELSPAQLFDLRVKPSDVLAVAGQTVKRVGSVYIVNYDVPALLHKNNRDTDVAVMIFRTSLDYDYFSGLLVQMKEGLVAARVMNPTYHLSRAVHHSKSPLEQVLDGMGYLYEPGGAAVPFDRLSFVAYCAGRGMTAEEVRGIVTHPLARFQEGDGRVVEDDAVSYTYHDSFQASLEKLQRMISQYKMPA